MNIRFAAEARASIREKRIWWEQHREKSPGLFRVELAATIAKIRNGTDAERRLVRVPSGRELWRLLMRRTRHHVYYRIDQDTATIALVENAQAGSEPQL